MQRRDAGYTRERMLKKEPQGMRRRGRPRRRAMDLVREDMQVVGVTKEDGEDRVRWR